MLTNVYLTISRIPSPVLTAKTQLRTVLINQIEIFRETRRPIPNMEVSLGRGPLILVSISSSRHRGAFISGRQESALCDDVIPRPPYTDNTTEFQRSLVR